VMSYIFSELMMIAPGRRVIESNPSHRDRSTTYLRDGCSYRRAASVRRFNVSVACVLNTPPARRVDVQLEGLADPLEVRLLAANPLDAQRLDEDGRRRHALRRALPRAEHRHPGPARYCSPRHSTPFDSRHEGSHCVSMTWRAASGRPYRQQRLQARAHQQALHRQQLAHAQVPRPGPCAPSLLTLASAPPSDERP